ncbi:LLM class flavin-dependent oxidoreductase [Chitinophaga sp. sic0106]|uniref:LLM class flavin-dependent oxidoreductase n=1 Tax=Chitinophaga sp. sic0106 TaxID=2854785 RepID=UPI001C46FDE7|nr:LLM class flavin-dependent oxidoreductase [Chitinophaga sp. sic0106]MBV7529112.1 LLM class flavin-dependent oxidoreductase [Chitinophaga sp. sic0106]
MKKIKLGILDQSIIARQDTAVDAIRRTSALVKLADELGYTRFWVSEHHNFPRIAGSTPEVLLAHLAGEAKRIRVGSGGIMLPNHSALKMAENFRMLETLFPGRIDLGIGRAPGGDRQTASLLNPSNTFNDQEFLQQLKDLRSWLTDHKSGEGNYDNIIAIPQAETVPEMWILSSSGGSGYFAAHLGMALSFAHFINPNGGPEAVQQYRQHFRPSELLKEPQVNVGIFGFTSEKQEEIDRWLAEMDFRMLWIETGARGEYPTYEEILEIEYTPAHLARIEYNRKRMLYGTPDQMKAKLLQIAEDYDTDEIILSTFADDFEAVKNSVTICANLF